MFSTLHARCDVVEIKSDKTAFCLLRYSDKIKPFCLIGFNPFVAF